MSATISSSIGRGPKYSACTLNMCWSIWNCHFLADVCLVIASIYYIFRSVITMWVIIALIISFVIHLLGCVIVQIFVTKETSVLEHHSAPTTVTISGSTGTVHRGYNFGFHRSKFNILKHFVSSFVLLIVIAVVIGLAVYSGTHIVNYEFNSVYIGYLLLAFVIGVIGSTFCVLIPSCCECCCTPCDPSLREDAYV